MCDFDKPDIDIQIPLSTAEVFESDKKTYDESNWQELMDDAIDFASTISGTYFDKNENEQRNEESSAYTSRIEYSDRDDDDETDDDETEDES